MTSVEASVSTGYTTDSGTFGLYAYFNGSQIYSDTGVGSVDSTTNGSATEDESYVGGGASVGVKITYPGGSSTHTITGLAVSSPSISISWSVYIYREIIDGVSYYKYSGHITASLTTISFSVSASGGGTVEVGGSTTVVIDISGGITPYTVILSYNGTDMIDESTDSSTASWAFNTGSSPINSKAQNSSYTLDWSASYVIGSSTISRSGTIDVGTDKLSVSVTPTGTVQTIINTSNPVTWDGSLSNTAETSGINWYLEYWKGSGTHNTYTIVSSSGLTASYEVTNNSSSAVNDASTGTTSVEFYVEDSYGNYSTSNLVQLAVFEPFTVGSSGSVSGVNIGSSNTLTITASGGFSTEYYYVLEYGGSVIAKSTTTATSFNWVFSSTSSPADTISNNTYTFTGSVTNGSSTLAIPDITVSTAKLTISASPSGNQSTLVGTDGAVSWTVDAAGTDESSVAYSIHYSNIGSNVLSNSTTWLSGGLSQTYSVSSTSVPLNDKNAGTTYVAFVVNSYSNLATSNTVTYVVNEPLSVTSSGSATNVNIASSNTITVNATGGTTSYYHYVLEYNGSVIAQSTTTSHTFTWTFDASSNPADTVAGGSYTFDGTVYAGSYSASIPDVTVSVSKMITTVSPTATQKIFTDETNAFTWSVSITGTDETTGFDYYIRYSNIGSTSLLYSTTWVSDVGTNESYTMSYNSIPVNDSANGIRYVQFYVKDQYSNYSTSATVAYQTTTAYHSNMTISGVGNVYKSSSDYTVYYVSPTQSPVFLDYVSFISTTTSIVVDLSSNWYSSTATTFSISGAGTHVIGTYLPLTLFVDVTELQGYGIGNTVYFVSEVVNNESGNLTYSTTHVIGLYIVSPLSVSVTPSVVDITAGQTSTTTITSNVSGADGGTFNYQWYYDGVASVTSQNFTVPTYSSTATTRSHSAFIQVTSGNTFEVVVSSLVTINVLGVVKANLNGGSSTYGIVGNTYGFTASVSGGKSPYTYKWSFTNGTSTSKLSFGGSVLSYVFNSAIPSGTITVVATDKNGRSGSSTVGLFIYSQQNPRLSASSTNILTNSTTVLTVSTSTTGSPAYTYVWYKNGSPVSGVISNTYQFSSATAGSYNINAFVTSTKTKFAQFSNSVTVNVHTPVAITVHPTLSTTKIGDTRTFSAYASYGLSPYVFSWFIGSSVNANGTTQSFNFSTTIAGTYTIKGKVVDNLGNSSTVGVTAYFTGNSLTVTAHSSASTTTVGDSVNFSAYAYGGISPYSYTWYTNKTATTSGATIISSTQNYTFIPSTTGTSYFYSMVTDNISSTAKSVYLSVYAQAVFPIVPTPPSASSKVIVNAYLSSTLLTTQTSPPNYQFTVLVNGVNVNAYNVDAVRMLDIAGELQFSTMMKYVVPTSGQQVINVGSPVQFYFQNKLVWTGVVENILKKSNMEYNIICFDNLYYLANLRVNYSSSTTENLGRIFAEVMRFGQVGFNMKSLSSSYNVTFGLKEPVYYDLMKIATIDGYKSWLDINGNLNISPLSTTTTIDLVENTNFISITKTNDVNYYFNTVQARMTRKGTTRTYTASVSTTNVANATTTPKVVDLTFINSPSASFGNEVASQFLNLFPNGYRYVKTWYQFATNQNYDLLNVGIGANFNITFRDGTVWDNMILYEVEINQTGVYLYFANFVKDIWSQLNSVTLLTS